jgi:hypothetical protein
VALADAELPVRAPELTEVRNQPVAFLLTTLSCGDLLRAAKKRRRCTSMAAGNMARISVSMVNSWA